MEGIVDAVRPIAAFLVTVKQTFLSAENNTAHLADAVRTVGHLLSIA
jgi:hypothetical protein